MGGGGGGGGMGEGGGLRSNPMTIETRPRRDTQAGTDVKRACRLQ